MKKVTIILTGVILMALNAINVNAQNTATVSDANASATIIAPIQIAQTTPLNFGVVGGSTSATNVILAHDNSRSGSATLYTGFGAAAATGIFEVQGTPEATFTITLPTSVTLTDNNTNTMTVTAWTTNLTTPAIELDGEVEMRVGATLNVGANQAAGTYNGTYAVTVAYN